MPEMWHGRGNVAWPRESCDKQCAKMPYVFGKFPFKLSQCYVFFFLLCFVVTEEVKRLCASHFSNIFFLD